MAYPRKMRTVALTNHATNNFWLLLKPEDLGSAPSAQIFCNSTIDFVISFEATDALRDLNFVAVDGVAVGVLLEFLNGISNPVWVKKVAAGAADQDVKIVY